MNRRLAALATGVALVALAVDQATKSWALAALSDRDEPLHVAWTLQLGITFNDGVAFSLGSGLGAAVVPIALLVIGIVLVTSRHLRGTPAGVAIGLVVGGALGNLTDRVVRGHDGAVVDWIDLQWWPVFNVADACVVVGGILLAVLSVRAEAPARA